MIKKLIIIFFVLFPFLALPQRKDLKLHFLAGASTGAMASIINMDAKNKLPNGVVYIGSATLAGFGKEIFDANTKGNKFDKADLVATILGGVVA